MDGSDIEHRSEIRRSNRAGPLIVAAVVAAVVGVALLGSNDPDRAEVPSTTTSSVPATPTSETLTTTAPSPPVVFGVTASSDGLAAFSTLRRPAPGAVDADVVAGRLAGPVVTEDRVAFLAGGELLTGRPGERLEALGCCWQELHPSNEPGHVWVRDGEEAALVLLDGGGTVTELVVDDDRILGPGAYGLVTVAADGTVRWRRPMFEPLDVPIGDGRQALDSGGDLVLAAVEDEVRVRRWELRSLVDGRLVVALDARGTWPRGTRGLLSPDGRHLAVPVPTGWAVRTVPDLQEVGRLTRSQPPVWIGDDRFAALADGHVLVSDGSEVPAPVEVLALAEQSP